MVKIHLIAKKYRLDKSRIKKLFQNQNRKALFFGSVKVLFRESESFRCGIIIPKKVFGPRSAAKRNYIRRFFYDEFFKLMKDSGEMKNWYLFYVNERGSGIETVKQSLRNAFDKLSVNEI